MIFHNLDSITLYDLGQMNKILLLTYLLSFAPILSGQNLYSELAASEEHSIFLDLLETTGLDSLLFTDAFYTVFAPNNETFESRYDSLALDSIKMQETAFLKSLLLNHFIPDTVHIDYITDLYLPLSGSHFLLYVDAAGSIYFESISSPYGEAVPRLAEPIYSDEIYRDLDNGRLIGLERNFVHPDCMPPSEWRRVVFGPMTSILGNTSWVDSLENDPRPKTFLCSTYIDVHTLIEENGGFMNIAYQDSFIQRHMIDGYLALQDIKERVIIKNVLGEDLIFTKVNGEYYLNDTIKITSFYDFKKTASFIMTDHIREPITTSTAETKLKHFHIFPNPASDYFTVEHSGESQQSTIKLYTMSGQKLYEKTYIGNNFQVDISELNAGTYVLEYQNALQKQRIILVVN